jgi:hypothetical protein
MQTKAEVALQVVQADSPVRAESSSTLVEFRPKVVRTLAEGHVRHESG